MSVTRLLEAFNSAGAGKVTAFTARLFYDHTVAPNMQVLAFVGEADGEAFSVVSQPFEGNPMDKARSMADELLKGQPA